MRTSIIPIPVLAVALQACTTEPELLNSERIKQTFGSYGIEVLQNDQQLRRSELYSLESGDKVCRTYAVVQFQEATNVRARTEHSSILDGASIGETFKSAGWRIYKQTLYIGSISPQFPDADILRMMRLDDTQELAMHVYQLLIEKEDVALEYATIVEVHHPEYLAESDLRDLFPVSESSLLSEDEITAIVSLVLTPQNH